MSYPKLIREIKGKPAMYLNKISIFTLKSYLDGYVLGSGKNIEELNEFQNFIVAKYGITPTISWDSIIYLHCNSDKHAFDKFFELFDIFMQQKI